MKHQPLCQRFCSLLLSKYFQTHVLLFLSCTSCIFCTMIHIFLPKTLPYNATCIQDIHIGICPYLSYFIYYRLINFLILSSSNTSKTSCLPSAESTRREDMFGYGATYTLSGNSLATEIS